jgi:hypothetical protein
MPASRSRVRQVCPQLMAGHLAQTRPFPGGVQDLIQPGRRQRSTPPRAFQHDEQPVGVDTGRTFRVEVGGHRGEEPAGDRDLPLMPALALGDEHPAGGDLQVLQAQAEDFAAAQPAQHHRLGHRPVAVRA